MIFETDDLQQTTYNLRKRIGDLQKTMDLVPTTAFAEICNEEYDKWQDQLYDSAMLAMNMTPEFGHELFIEPLARVLRSYNAVRIRLVDNKNDVRVEIDLEAIAGDLGDYARGIRYARKVLDQEAEAKARERAEAKGKEYKKKKKRKSPEKASAYWRKSVYGPAREGDGGSEESHWARTIQLRLSVASDLAPYWPIVDQGVAELSTSYGGTPYPEIPAPTRFVDQTERMIRAEASVLYIERKDELYGRIEREIADLEQVENDIASALNVIQSDPESYSEPQIVREIAVDGKSLYIYVTQTQQIGLAREPRAFGRRLPRR